jgi:microcystin-dependent protein
VGANRDTWGALLNADWDTVDDIMAALCPIGTVADFAGPNAPAGWLMCDGTVYPISSYSRLASAIGNTYGGDGSTTFAVPDCRGRVTAGVGTTTDLGGYLSGFSLGQKYGFYQFTISATYLPSVEVTIDQNGSHSHNGYTDFQGLHAHNGTTDAQGVHAHSYSYGNLTTSGGIAAGSPYNVPTTTGTTSTAGNHAHNITTTTDGNHNHNVQTYDGGLHTHTGRIAGGGYPIPIMQPLIAFNKIIFAGPPGYTEVPTAIPGAPARLASPMRGPS